jgi:glycerol-3-phosphate dehydrogenase
LPTPLLQRYARAYGTRIHTLLARLNSLDALGSEVLPGLYEAEIEYLMTHEWARSSADILWRRGKLGLHLAKGTSVRLDEWIVRGQGAKAMSNS